jgi:hypothetical protein
MTPVAGQKSGASGSECGKILTVSSVFIREVVAIIAFVVAQLLRIDNTG